MSSLNYIGSSTSYRAITTNYFDMLLIKSRDLQQVIKPLKLNALNSYGANDIFSM